MPNTNACRDSNDADILHCLLIFSGKDVCLVFQAIWQLICDEVRFLKLFNNTCTCKQSNKIFLLMNEIVKLTQYLFLLLPLLK